MSAEVIPIFGSYDQLEVRYDEQLRTVWYYIDPQPRACFNLGILAELRRFQDRVIRVNRVEREGGAAAPVQYTILASRTPGVFNYGGDLNLFVRLIKRRNREGLRKYARACIDVLHPNAISLGQRVTTISLVQGDALGGGCEAALSSNVVVAEESAKFGLPEILFNLFPGMGAYSLLGRRLNSVEAERMILSGDLHSARTLHEMGLVDVLALDGEGETAVLEYIRRHKRRSNAHQALLRVRERFSPLTYDELVDIAEIWVDAALNLGPRDLRMMERLVRAQSKGVGSEGERLRTGEKRA